MNEKIIDEVMELVDGLLEHTLAITHAKTAQELNSAHGEQVLSVQAIRAKLREVMERKPLTDEQIEQAIGSKIGQPIFLVAKGFVQATERAHGIGS